MHWLIFLKTFPFDILCLILSDIVIYCQILSDIVIYCQILWNIVWFLGAKAPLQIAWVTPSVTQWSKSLEIAASCSFCFRLETSISMNSIYLFWSVMTYYGPLWPVMTGHNRLWTVMTSHNQLRPVMTSYDPWRTGLTCYDIL